MKFIKNMKQYVRDMFCKKDIVDISSKKMTEYALSFVMTLIMIGGILFGSKQVADYTNKALQVTNQDLFSNADSVEPGSVTDKDTVKDKNTVADTDTSAQYIVVVDAGHGGRDSGKTSDTGTEEKDINLSIALMVQENLENAGITVVMTRTEDVGLYNDGDSNKKVADMKARLSVIEESNCNFAVSIHQNSYSDPSIKGAQVFYYATSTEGKELAEKLQQDLVDNIDPDNHRKAKANDTYYLLKKTSVPMIIVECGFLTCPEEEKLLLTEEYQKKLAEQIAETLISYLKE